MLGEVSVDGPAARAGLRAGDEILSINGEPVRDFLALVNLVRAHPDETLTVQYRREGREASARLAVGSVVQGGMRIGRIQVSQPRVPRYPPGMLRHVSYGPLAALGRGLPRGLDHDGAAGAHAGAHARRGASRSGTSAAR